MSNANPTVTRLAPNPVTDNPTTREQRTRFLSRQSVIEMRARDCARALLHPGTFRELLGPFDRLESPWLPMQGIVPESDDGVIVARGLLAGRPAVVMAIEGAFQGGGMGEVSGSKIAGACAGRGATARGASRSCRSFFSRRAASACRRLTWARRASPRSIRRSSRCVGWFRSLASLRA